MTKKVELNLCICMCFTALGPYFCMVKSGSFCLDYVLLTDIFFRVKKKYKSKNFWMKL